MMTPMLNGSGTMHTPKEPKKDDEPDWEKSPYFKGLDGVPSYLTEFRSSVDLSLSEELIDYIGEINTKWEEWSTEQLYGAFQRVLTMYRSEKGEEGCPDTLALLSMLFWEVTSRTKIGLTAVQKGKRIPYWGLNIFNYALILGRAEPNVAAISWRLTAGVDLPVNEKTGTSKIAVSTVVELYKLVKKVAKARKLPEEQVYVDAIRVTREHNTAEETGLNRVWSEEVQNAILKHFDMKPLRPKGQRKRKEEDTMPPPEVEPTIPPDAPTVPSLPPDTLSEPPLVIETKRGRKPKPAPEITEMAPVKKPRGRPRKPRVEETPTRPTYAEELRITAEISTLVKQLIELRLGEVPLEQHVSLQEMTITMVDGAIGYFNARCNRLVKEQMLASHTASLSAELIERTKYEEACRHDYFGYELKPGEIVDYDRYLKKIYLRRAADSHPDRHPDRLADYLKLNQLNEIILTYNAKHQAHDGALNVTPPTTKKRK